ncbi:MAG: di-heme oxidoredictase family protein [Rhodospirillaceae bacterium]
MHLSVRAWAVLLSLWSSSVCAADGAVALATGPAAYQQPLPGLTGGDFETFREGAGVFRAAWLKGPSIDTPRFTGLGPLFNRRSCVACHIGNGRGEPPAEASDQTRSLLIRLSLPGADATGGPRAHPAYGDQIQTDAVIGAQPEGRVRFHWMETRVALADGTVVLLRRPEIVLRDLAHGPLPAEIQMSARISPAVFGLGLLEGVSGETLIRMAREKKADGVRGRVNMVWDVHRKQAVPGRFGLKANQPTLRQQIAAALAGDMGITSSFLLSDECPAAAKDCRDAGSAPEIADADFEALARYVAGLAPPPPRPRDAVAAVGAKTFADIGCNACHRETLEARSGALAAYTDLLLHDMGDGLADGRPDFLAGGREWRTPPLWGIGLASTVNDTAAFLHDGRARTLAEAILWHGGEATTARDRFTRLSKGARDALLAFLGTL